MPLRQRQDTIASTPCGSSSMQKEGQHLPQHHRLHYVGSLSNTHCSWSGMSLTASAPNALSPFLPTLIEALERQEHLHFSEECRSQLLSMSAAGRHGLSTTCAGTLLKQQIPIRTFKEWNETQLGLTFSGRGAHCDADREGGYPYTRTLNDRVFPAFHNDTYLSYLPPFLLLFNMLGRL